MSHSKPHTEPTAGEAARLHRSVFGRDPSDAVVERFVRVSRRLHALVSEDEVVRYYRAIARCGDLEALEVAARYRGRIPLLTRKLRMIVYLAETVPESQRFFVKERPGRLAAIAAIAAGAFRTAYKLVKGTALLSKVSND